MVDLTEYLELVDDEEKIETLESEEVTNIIEYLSLILKENINDYMIVDGEFEEVENNIILENIDELLEGI